MDRVYNFEALCLRNPHQDPADSSIHRMFVHNDIQLISEVTIYEKINSIIYL